MIFEKAGMVELNDKFLSKEEKYTYKVKMLRKDKNFVVPAEDNELKKFWVLG
jgi:hypothetical protein